MFNLGLAESKLNEVRAKELELSSASEIFVDMDGVLVDFGAWTKLMKVKKWFLNKRCRSRITESKR